METPAMAHDLSSTRVTVTGCVEYAGLFQDPMLEDQPSPSAPADERRRYAGLERAAADICASCPLLSPCLYRAVVQHDVAGFVAGTTQKQRLEIRARLSVKVEAEDLDTLAGVARQHRQVDHAEVVRLRSVHPDESLEQLARRLGCSLSTVKRHLRTERRSPGGRAFGDQQLPTQCQVMAAHAQLNGGRQLREDAAA
jgi:AraC-like DNA-binding protein